ncbi:MAG: DUF134 domain-containing protein [Clostridia bacterium]|nr:DUF134 domain-containing protein [Clostridia bacterium]MBN2883352.1 DUF134 domain-containing protein [Clostridia bacterium]
MPRPRKWRKVCCLPEWRVFGPVGPGKGRANMQVMTVDEYETIRLIDYEGMTQEECAISMNVARTTVQRIYNDARKKISAIFVDGDLIRIEGGDYKLFTEIEHQQGYGSCRRHRGQNRNYIEIDDEEND